MNTRLPSLDENQWNLLGILSTLDLPLSLDLAGSLCPISLEGFSRLLGEGPYETRDALIRANENGQVFLSPDLPRTIVDQLDTYVHSEAFSECVARVNKMATFHQIPFEILERILYRTGRFNDLAHLEMRLAREAMEKGDQPGSMRHLTNVAETIRRLPDTSVETDRLLVDAMLALSDLQSPLGSGSEDLPPHMKMAHLAAQRIDDRRSLSYINLLLDNFYPYKEEPPESSLDRLTDADWALEDLGDKNILRHSAVVLGLEAYLLGRFGDAEIHLEQSARAFYLHGAKHLAMGSLHIPLLLSLCAAQKGHLQDTVGKLECFRRIADRQSLKDMSACLRGCMGLVLLMFGIESLAEQHLKTAKKEAEALKYAHGLELADLCLYYLQFRENSPEALKKVSREYIKKTFSNLQVDSQKRSPYVRRILLELHRADLPLPFQSTIEEETAGIMNGSNAYLKGVVYRMLAEEASSRDEDTTRARTYLSESRKHLIQSGDPVELALTYVTTARMEMRAGADSRARTAAKKAYRTLPDSTEGLFPDDLLPLVGEASFPGPARIYKDLFTQLMAVANGSVSKDRLDSALMDTMKYVCRLLAAERGAMFRIGKKTKRNRQSYVRDTT